jgi:nucleoside-triphosphatase
MLDYLKMDLTKKNCLITGFPGVGKTTLIKKLYQELRDFHPVGFYTEEIREKGIRKGFELISLDGRRGLLSHVEIKSSLNVGKYKVDTKGFEEFLDSIPFFGHTVSLVIIDEIGKMECFSEKFKKLLKWLLDSKKVVLATIAFKSGGFIEEIKKRGDIKVFEMTHGNRESLLFEILSDVRSLLR